MRDHEPPRFGLERGSAIAELCEFPGALGRLDHLALVPEADVVRPHQEVVLVVQPGERGIAPVDHAGKERDALVLGGRAVQRRDSESQEIGCLYQLREDLITVERRILRRSTSLFRRHG